MFEVHGRTPIISSVLGVGGTATGRLLAPGAFEWFAVELVSGRSYALEFIIKTGTQPTERVAVPFQCHIAIHDAGGALLAGSQEDGQDSSENPTVTFTAARSGDHYISVHSQRGKCCTFALKLVESTLPSTPGEANADSMNLSETHCIKPAHQSVQRAATLDGAVGTRTPAIVVNGSPTRVSLDTVPVGDPTDTPDRYSLVGGDNSGLFELDAATGELFFKGSDENFKNGATEFKLTVRATRGETYVDQSVIISVTKVPDRPSSVARSGADAHEHDPSGSERRISLGTVSGTNPQDAPRAYHLMEGNEAGLFELDKTTGELYFIGTAENLERATTGTELKVRVSADPHRH